MQLTSHFQLSPWEGEDRILRENFNSDNAKVDAALADHAAALAGCGNCRLWATTYVGTDECGPSHPNHLTFPNGMPLAALVFSYCGEIMVLVPNATSTTYHTYMDTTYGYNRMQVSWSGNTVSWYSDQTQKPAYQMHSPSPYHVLAFYQADAE